MTWENYGTLWHIDNNIPLKYANSTPEEAAGGLHFTNTQPLIRYQENVVKGNRHISEKFILFF